MVWPAIGMLLIYRTNWGYSDTAQQLQLDTMGNATKYPRAKVFGNKSRAGGKTVLPEFGVKFEPIFRKILGTS